MRCVTRVTHQGDTPTFEENMKKQQVQMDTNKRKLHLLLCAPKKHAQCNNNEMRALYGCVMAVDHLIT